MIVSFFVRNYKSILEEEFDFRFAEGKAPNGYKDADYFTFLSEKNVRCVPVLAIFGANGSGKTNILKALRTFQEIASFGIAGKYAPNKLNRKYNTTTFAITFVTQGDTYVYSIEYDIDEIKEESLRKNNKLLLEVKDKRIKFDSPSKDQLGKVESTFNESCLDKGKHRNSLIAMIRHWLSGLHSGVSIASDFMQSLSYCNNSIVPDAKASIDLLMRCPEIKTRDEAFLEIVKHLQLMDINVSGAKLDCRRICTGESEYLDGRRVSNWFDDIIVYHKDMLGKDVPLHLFEESAGTQLLFGLIGTVLYVLKKGGTLLVDELEKSLHPFILGRIVRLFKDKSANKKNAQLIYSTHDTSVLEDELLRISEAAFITNFVTDGTKIKRLCDYNGITNSDNFRKLYVNGQLGSVPLTIN